MASSDCRFNYPYLRGYFDIKLSLLEGIFCMCNVTSDVTNRAFLSNNRAFLSWSHVCLIYLIVIFKKLGGNRL